MPFMFVSLTFSPRFTARRFRRRRPSFFRTSRFGRGRWSPFAVAGFGRWGWASFLGSWPWRWCCEIQKFFFQLTKSAKCILRHQQHPMPSLSFHLRLPALAPPGLGGAGRAALAPPGLGGGAVIIQEIFFQLTMYKVSKMSFETTTTFENNNIRCLLLCFTYAFPLWLQWVV